MWQLAKVIETNLSMKDNEIMDLQSRVIEVDSWNSYINEIGNGDTINRSSIVGSMYGNSIPSGAKIENFTYNDITLSCDFYNYCGIHSKKLAYLAEDNKKIEFVNGSTIEFLKRRECDQRQGMVSWSAVSGLSERI